MKGGSIPAFKVVATLLLAAALVIPGATPAISAVAQGTDSPTSAPHAAHGPDPTNADAITALALRGMAPTPAAVLAFHARDAGLTHDAPAPPALEEAAPLPAALEGLAAATGVPTDTTEWDAAMARAAALPPDLQQALSLLVLSTADAHNLQKEATRGISAEEANDLLNGELSPAEVEALLATVDREASLEAAARVHAATAAAEPTLTKWAIHQDQARVTRVALAPNETTLRAAVDPVAVVEALAAEAPPADVVRAAGGLRAGGAVDDAAVPAAILNLTLAELLTATYATMGLPLDVETLATFHAAEGLDPDLKAVLATGLRHTLAAQELQRRAMADVSTEERALLVHGAPLAMALMGTGQAAGPLDAAFLKAYFNALDSVDAGLLSQAALLMLQGADEVSAATAAPGFDVTDDVQPATTQTHGDTPEAPDPTASRSVAAGGLRVTVEDDGNGRSRLVVDLGDDGRPEVDYTTENDLRVIWDHDRYSVLVYSDDNGDGFMQESEVEFRSQPLRDRGNHVAFVDPFGFIIVGGVDQGSTTYDARYGHVQVPPEPRRDRVRSVEEEVRRNSARNIAHAVADILRSFGGPDTRGIEEELLQEVRYPENVTINPNSTQLLTIDLGGHSRHHNNAGGSFFAIYNVTADPFTYGVEVDAFLKRDPYEGEGTGDDWGAGPRRFSCDRFQGFSWTTATGEDREWGVRGLPVRGGDDWLGFPGQGQFIPRDCFYGDRQTDRLQRFADFRAIPSLAVDVGGNDLYATRLAESSFGAGMVGGVGVHVDAGGADVYRAWNLTLGGARLGGVGVHVDLGEEGDAYTAINESMGAGVVGSVGVFYNHGGDETYASANRSQGTGILGGVGLMVEAGGDDAFQVRARSQGHADTAALGVLLERGGNDTYGVEVEQDHGKSQGFGLNESLALLVDLAGRDTGLRWTNTVHHPAVGELRLGTYTHDDRIQGISVPVAQLRTGLVVDANITAEGFQPDGFLFDAGETRVNGTEDPVTEEAYYLTVPSLLGVGDAQSTTWRESYAVSVDIGGGDRYLNRPASASLLAHDFSAPATNSREKGVTGQPDWHPALASVHLDLRGHDEYRVGDSKEGREGIAYAFAGVALFYDVGGTADRYTLGQSGLGAADLGGVAVFTDDGGNDAYNAPRTKNFTETRALGYGSIGGLGVFLEGGGDDTYRAGDLTLGAYNHHTTESSLSIAEAGEAGAGVFYDADGADSYDASLASQGALSERLTKVVGQDRPRTALALFIDDGFAYDAYSEALVDAGRGNNRFWQGSAPVARGFDNLDYFLHTSLVDAGGPAFQRLVAMLLSPSVNIEEVDGRTAEWGLDGVGGVTTVEVTTSYGGPRAVALNARGLALSALSEAGLEGDAAEALRDVARGALDAAGNVTGVDTGAVDELGPLAHWGVDYANLTYRGLINFMKGPQPTECGTGLRCEHWNASQERYQETVAPNVTVNAGLFTWNPKSGRDPLGAYLVNETVRSAFIRYVRGQIYDKYGQEVFGIRVGETVIRTAAENADGFERGEYNWGLLEDAVGPAYRDVFPLTPKVWTAGHDAVDVAFGDDSQEPSTSASHSASPAPDPAAADALMLVKILAAGTPGEEVTGDAVDRILGQMATPQSEHGAADVPDVDVSSTELPSLVRQAFAAAERLPASGGDSVGAVEIQVDGITVDAAPGDGGTRYTLTWDSAALDPHGVHLFPDGAHTLEARAYYTEATLNADQSKRRSDPYGYYPGTDRLKVVTDNAPRMYLAHATDFNPDAPCDSGARCALELYAVASEPVTARYINVTAPGGGLVRVLHQDVDSVHVGGINALGLPYPWDGNVSAGQDIADGAYNLSITFTDSANVTTVHNATFHVERQAPSTVPVVEGATDRGLSGYPNVWVLRNANGGPRDDTPAAYRLNVTVALEPGTVSPVAGFDLFARAHRPDGTPLDPASWCPVDEPTASDFRTDAGNAAHADGWCLIGGNATGDRATVNITRRLGAQYLPLDGHTIYLVAVAENGVGTPEAVTLPEMGDTARAPTGAEFEAATRVDLTRPVSSVDTGRQRVNTTTVTIPWATDSRDVASVKFQYAFTNASTRGQASGLPWTTLPLHEVRAGPTSVKWRPDHEDVNATVNHTDLLYARFIATDHAGNQEIKTGFDHFFEFDFERPGIQDAVAVERDTHGAVVEFTTDEQVSRAHAVVWPANGTEAGDGRTVAAVTIDEGFTHRVEVTGLHQDAAYRARLVFTDVAGNANNSRVVDVTTLPVVQVEGLSPAAGDVVSGVTSVDWRADAVHGDLDVFYDLRLSVDGGATCALPVDNATFFEEASVRRRMTFDSSRFPDTTEAVFCLRANNTLNPGDPVEVRIPSEGAVTIDNHAPVTTVNYTGDRNGTWFRGPVDVRLTTTDTITEGLTTRYAVGSGAAQDYAGEFTIRDDGAHRLRYWSEDRLGHREEVHDTTVYVDATAPTGELLVGAAGATRTRNVTITINATDGVSGVHRAVVRSDGAALTIPGAALAHGAVEVPWELSEGDGDKVVTVVLWDAAGNRATLRKSLRLDTTAPTVRSVGVEHAGFTNAVVRWTTSEAATGTLYYRPEGSPAWRGRVPLDELRLDQVAAVDGLRPATNYVFQVEAVDALGNVVRRNGTFTTAADLAPPGAVGRLQAEDLRTGFARLTWDAAFDDVGISRYLVLRAADGGAFEALGETPRTTFLDDAATPGETYRYAVVAVDHGGNSGPRSDDVSVTVTTRPELLDPAVTPEKGAAGETFTYSVVVRDRDGDLPAFVRVLVNGEAKSMQPSQAGGDIRQGVRYVYATQLNATRLSDGVHTYQFTVSDGANTVRAPTDAPQAGPMVVADDDDDSGLAIATSVQRIVPAAGPILLLAALAIAGVAALRRREGWL